MNWLRKVMTGRNGSDQLSIALLAVSIILVFVSQITGLEIITYLSYLPLALCVFRMFSKNIDKRRLENYKFTMLISPLYSWGSKKIKRLRDSKTHKYFSCPSCKSQLRVPKGKGKVNISCPNCRTEFIGKT